MPMAMLSRVSGPAGAAADFPGGELPQDHGEPFCFATAIHSVTMRGNSRTTSRPNRTSSTYPMWSMSTIRHRYDFPQAHQVKWESAKR